MVGALLPYVQWCASDVNTMRIHQQQSWIFRLNPSILQLLFTITASQCCNQTMNIDLDIKVKKPEIVNQLIEEVYRIIEEIEQQVREDLKR